MKQQVDFYGTYTHFSEGVFDTIRKETFGEDIGQNSWTTSDEYDRFISWLELPPESQVLEVCSGSGGPALYLAQRANCRVTGIDASEGGISTAVAAAAAANQTERVSFQLADVNATLPFADDSFDGLLCVDALNHFPNRMSVLHEWHRVLKPGGHAVFTDPVVITGPVTNDELARRSAVGLFLFVPPGINERLIDDAGFRLAHAENLTRNAARVSSRWREARENHRDALVQIEGEERFTGLQDFFDAAHRMSAERRLSRIVYVAEKRS